VSDYSCFVFDAEQTVMKKIGALTNVARNDEFNITDRANKLMTDVSVIFRSKGVELIFSVVQHC